MVFAEIDQKERQKMTPEVEYVTHAAMITLDRQEHSPKVLFQIVNRTEMSFEIELPSFAEGDMETQFVQSSAYLSKYFNRYSTPIILLGTSQHVGLDSLGKLKDERRLFYGVAAEPLFPTKNPPPGLFFVDKKIIEGLDNSIFTRPVVKRAALSLFDFYYKHYRDYDPFIERTWNSENREQKKIIQAYLEKNSWGADIAGSILI